MTKEIAKGITVNPDIMVGKPVIKGTRMPVDLVIAKLAANPDIQEFFTDYPEITIDEVKNCLAYAKELVEKDSATHITHRSV
jgi:uncharacterized protein (DUF433 family)